MRKRFIIGLLIAFLPIFVFAQVAGGQIRRPDKKQQKTNTTPAKNKQSQKKGNEQKSSKSSNEAIIQRLINNMVYVEGGTFTMGATPEQGSDAGSEEEPAHQVTLSSFRIGKYEVTQEEWIAVMGNNPSSSKGAKRPVDNVSWNECQEFIHKLNAMTGKHFRLPSEAEWEYAARGGNKSFGYKYSGSDDVNRVAWYDGNSGGVIHDVGQKSPNELGLYDMNGNVCEWCQDKPRVYKSESLINPTGDSTTTLREFRGGSKGGKSKVCRVSSRYQNIPSYFADGLGLRLAL